jgi:DNA polymerase-3 subunit gamma/tau
VDFDEADPRCAEITEGRSMDVLEIDGASNNGVEQVRELRETCKYAPASSKFKIYIIDEVHMLSAAAFNALLKTLEEPPAHVKFMFATTDPEKVLATILSRCQRFDLRRIPVTLIVKHLTQIAQQEKVKIDAAALYAIARGADGGMRDAESALDQLISFCGETIAEDDVLSMFGLTAQSHVLGLVNGVLQTDAASVLRELNDLAKHGKDLGRLLSDLLNYFRNLLIYLVSGGDLSLLEVSEAEAASLKENSAAATTETLTRIMEVLTEAESRLRDAASKKIFLEVALLRAIQARNAVSLDAVLKQLNQLRQQGGEAGPGSSVAAPAGQFSLRNPASAAPAPAAEARRPVEATLPPRQPAAPTEPAAVIAPSQPAEVKAEPLAKLGQLWPALMDAVTRARPMLKGYFAQAFPVSFAKNLLTIGFDPEFADQMDLVNTPATVALLQTKLAELGNASTSVKFVKTERPGDWTAAPQQSAPAAAPEPAPRPAAPASTAPAKVKKPAGHAAPAPMKMTEADFKNDPLIQKALEEFKGQIVNVGA